MKSNFPTIEKILGYETITPVDDFVTLPVGDLVTLEMWLESLKEDVNKAASIVDDQLDSDIDKYLPKEGEISMQVLPEEFVQSDENFGFAITEEHWKKIPTLLKQEFAENFPFSVFGNTPFHIKNGCYLVSEDQLKLIFSALQKDNEK